MQKLKPKQIVWGNPDPDRDMEMGYIGGHIAFVILHYTSGFSVSNRALRALTESGSGVRYGTIAEAKEYCQTKGIEEIIDFFLEPDMSG